MARDRDDRHDRLRGRRRALLDDFEALWHGLRRKGFRARLEFVVSERSHTVHEPLDAGEMMEPAS